MNNPFKLLLLSAFSAAAAGVVSCGPPEEPEAGRGEPVEVTLHVLPEDGYRTRSSFTWGESEIKDVQIVVTDEAGDVVEVLYSSPAEDMHFTGVSGSRYRLWAAANLGGRVEVSKLGDFNAVSRSISSSGIASSGIPMFNGPEGQELVLGSGSAGVDIPLTRMMARVDLRIDTGSLTNAGRFYVQAVKICNAINSYTPFATDARQQHSGKVDYSFDYASKTDISSLNSGKTVSLYAFENKQGTLLPGNTDPWQKVPSNIGSAADYCTYLEVDCQYGSPSTDVTYRMYLGSDATTNFDVERNTVYKLTLKPSESEIRGERGSWKLESGPWNQITDIQYSVSPSTLYLDLDGDYGALTSYITLTYEDGTTRTNKVVSLWSADSEALKVFEARPGSALNTLLNVNTMELRAISEGQARIKASTVYNSTTYTQYCDVIVNHVPVTTEKSEFELTADPSSVTLSEGEKVQITVTLTEKVYQYVDDVLVSPEPISVTTTDVTELAEWIITSGGGYVTHSDAGSFEWASGPGTAVIGVAYEGSSTTVEITTEEPHAEPSLSAGISVQDTWGGNLYPVTLLYDDGRGHKTDVTSLAAASFSFSGGIPSEMLVWDGSGMAAADWWGRSGAWVTASPSYTLTLTYNGLSVEISGTMHGYTRAEVAPEKQVWYYTEIENNGWSGPAAIATLIGSDRTTVRTTDTSVGASYILSNGNVGLGTGIPFHAVFTDPSNGLQREGDAAFDVQTNVVTLQVNIRVEFAQYGETVDLVTSTSTDGTFLGSAGVRNIESGIPSFYVDITQEIWYEDYKGDTHHITFSDGSVPASELVSLTGEWSLESNWRDVLDEDELRTVKINVNGFSASWNWGVISGR